MRSLALVTAICAACGGPQRASGRMTARFEATTAGDPPMTTVTLILAANDGKAQRTVIGTNFGDCRPGGADSRPVDPSRRRDPSYPPPIVALVCAPFAITTDTAKLTAHGSELEVIQLGQDLVVLASSIEEADLREVKRIKLPAGTTVVPAR